MISLISKRLPDVAIVLFALWTLCCHCVVVFGGNTYALVRVVSIVAGAVIGIFCAWALITIGKYRAGLVFKPPKPEFIPQVPVTSGLDSKARWTIVSLTILLLGMWFVFRNPFAQWIATVVYLSCCYLLVVQRPIVQSGHVSLSNIKELGLWAMALAGCFISLYVHRWRNDDCYYINIAVTTADMPELPLLSISNVQQSVPNAPGLINGMFQSIFIPYKTHSFEVLGGFLAFLTGVDAIEIIHVWLCGLFALLILFAVARLYRTLDPDRWFWMVVATFAFFIFEGSSGLGYSNHAFVRSFTGKSVMLSFGLPMLIAHGIRFGMRPTWKRFLMLCSAQVTCLGLTSTSLWLAPAAAVLSTIVPLRFEKKAFRTVGWAMLSCLYIIGAALWVRTQVFQADTNSAVDAVTHMPRTKIYLRLGLIHSAFRRMFSEPTVIQTYLSLLAVSIAAARTSLARRYVIVFCLALAAFLMNPYLADMLRHNVYGKFTGQRTMWLAPVVAAVSICAVSFIPSTKVMWKRLIGLVAMGGALFLLFYFVPTKSVLARRNNVFYTWPPESKVPRNAFHVAKQLTDLLSPDSYVLAPEKISQYLPTIHHHPIPVLANAKYLKAPYREKRKRQQMVRWIESKKGSMNKELRKEFLKDLEHYNVSAIVVNRNGLRNWGLRKVLRKAGFDNFLRSHAKSRIYIRNDRQK